MFVSHNMAAVEKLCRRGIVLNQGCIQYIGNQTEAITRYLAIYRMQQPSFMQRKDREGSGEIRIINMEIRDLNGNVLDTVKSGQDIEVYLYFETQLKNHLNRIIANLSIKTQLDMFVFSHHSRLSQNDFGWLSSQGILVCRINRLPLPPSTYPIRYSILRDGEILDALNDAIELSVIDGDFYGSGEVPPISIGVCLVDAQWHIKSLLQQA